MINLSDFPKQIGDFNSMAFAEEKRIRTGPKEGTSILQSLLLRDFPSLSGQLAQRRTMSDIDVVCLSL